MNWGCYYMDERLARWKEFVKEWKMRPKRLPNSSHDWHPNDDIISCVLCGCRTYNDEAKQPCKGAS